MKPARKALLDLLLRYGANPNSRDYNWASPLYWSVRLNCNYAVWKLIEYGANVNAPSFDKLKTPLHTAAITEQVGAVRLLLEAGAYAHLKDEYKKTPLDYAIDSVRRSRQRSTSESVDTNSAQRSSQESNSEKIVKLLIASLKKKFR